MLRIIAILILLFIAVRFLGRIFMPPVRRQDNRHRNSYQNDNRKEGDVRIEYTDPEKAKQRPKDTGEGEYVDFEELD